jgi:hypothetical protein
MPSEVEGQTSLGSQCERIDAGQKPLATNGRVGGRAGTERFFDVLISASAQRRRARQSQRCGPWSFTCGDGGVADGAGGFGGLVTSTRAMISRELESTSPAVLSSTLSCSIVLRGIEALFPSAATHKTTVGSAARLSLVAASCAFPAELASASKSALNGSSN